MTAPDVRVRLSAEGTDEVIRAFQNVAAAAQKSGKTGSQGIGVLNAALGELKALLPAIGVAAAVTGIAVLVKNALGTADAIGKLSQKVGISTETLSVLSYGAVKAGVDFEQLSKGLGKFNKFMADLDHGSSTAGAAVRRLFGDSKALDGLDTEQRFQKVVEALGKMPAGYEKTRAAQEFFGKSAMDLIPLMNDLSEGGFAKLKKRAEELGLIISTKMADAAIRMTEDLQDLKLAAVGLATQFVSGLAPAAADAAEAMARATTGEGANGFQKLGELVGSVVKGIVGAFILVGSTLGFVFGEASLFIEQWGTRAFRAIDDVILKTSIAANLALGRTHVAAQEMIELSTRQSTRKPVADFSAGADARLLAFQAETQRAMIALFSPTAAPTKVRPTAEGGAAPSDNTGKGQVAALKAQLADELALYKSQDELLAAQQKRAYDAGTLSIAEYFADRHKAITDGSAKEISALQQERAAIAKAPIVEAGKSSDQIDAERLTRKTELASIDTKIAVARNTAEKEHAALGDEQGKAETALAEKRLEVEKLIQTAQGDTYGAAIDAIKKQAVALASAHVPQALIDQLSALQTAAARMKDLERQGSLAMGGLAATHAGLQTGVATGELFPFQALEQYDRAVQAALPHLRALAAAQLAASTTPEERQKALQFSDSIEQMAATSDRAAQGLAKIKAGIETGVQGAFTNFFETGIESAHSFGEAMSQLALSVVNSLKAIVSQMLATIVTQKLLGLFGGSGAGGGSSASGILSGVGDVAMAAGTALAAEGGYVAGPGTATSDSIPARLSAGEYVVRAAAVASPGALAALEQLNRGIALPAFRALGSYRRGYAEGGLVAPGAAVAGGGSSSSQVVVSLSQGLVAEHIESGPGSRAVIRTIGANRNAIKAALGIP